MPPVRPDGDPWLFQLRMSASKASGLTHLGIVGFSIVRSNLLTHFLGKAQLGMDEFVFFKFGGVCLLEGKDGML